MKEKSLMQQSLSQFTVCIAVLLLLATPLFYWLTKNFYAEDMIDIIEAVQQGNPVPAIDLEADILNGIVIQFAIIASILGISIILMVRFLSKRLWRPFDETLIAIEAFRLESGTVPALPDSNIKEFSRLNAVLTKLMSDTLNSYRTQKEFTENASHELQTPLAIFQSKLDLLLQQQNITEEQAAIMHDLYQTSSRLSRLNRNLLLLAKMENNQFDKREPLNIISVLNGLTPYFETIADGLTLRRDISTESLDINANKSLLESLVSNLFVNAVRHNIPEGTITVSVTGNTLLVSNTSEESALDSNLIFNRFYRPSDKSKGNGLGLAIAKAVCDYHGWEISYFYNNGIHTFAVTFH